MIHLTFRTNALLITMPLLALLASSNTHAEIYKWRDNRGVTQYSDRPPVSSFSKLTSNELVNSLQTKDLCTVGPIKKSVASNAVASAKENSGLLSIFSRATAVATPAKSVAVASNTLSGGAVTVMAFAKAAIAPLQIANATPTLKPVTAVVSTLPIAPVVPAVIPPVVSNPTQPTKTTPSITAPPTQVATSPPATTNTLNPVSDVANIIQKALMPAVNISKNMPKALGWSDLRIRPNLGPQDVPTAGDGDGQFRIDCDVSHMSNDDPLLYPNQQSAAHHHTFFGNTSTNYQSNLDTLSTTGNSTCRGGIANRSAYWVPSIIDISTNTPIKPDSALWYYKTGYVVNKSKITAPPKGLKIIAGNMKSTSAATSSNTSFSCWKDKEESPPATKNIPICSPGGFMVTHIGFPQCWDGKNLDSPNHQDHMAYTVNGGCPVTHPIAIPKIDLNVWYKVPSDVSTKNWRLSSDNYTATANNAGYSSHADWVNGWDEKVMNGIVKNCLNAGKNCGNHMLGDGTVIYGLNRDF